jgi:hypothetical protein
MKKLYLITVTLLMGAGTVFAQDTIVFRNGDELKVKVKEVSDTELKYQLWNNQDGPMYTKRVSEIFMVKYKGGYREVYGNTKQPSVNAPQTGNTSYDNGTYNYSGDGHMEHSDGDLLLNRRKMNDAQIKDVLGIRGYETYKSASAQRRSGKTLVTLGWIEFGLGVGFFTLAAIVEDGDVTIPGSILIFASQIELPLGYVLKGVGTSRLNWLVDDYNSNRSSYSDNLSIGFAPTLVCAPDAAGNRTFGLGAGLSLHF